MECIAITKTLKCMFCGVPPSDCGHKTSRPADMNRRFKPHFTAKIGQSLVPTSQKMILFVDAVICDDVRSTCCNICSIWSIQNKSGYSREVNVGKLIAFGEHEVALKIGADESNDWFCRILGWRRPLMVPSKTTRLLLPLEGWHPKPLIIGSNLCQMALWSNR